MKVRNYRDKEQVRAEALHEVFTRHAKTVQSDGLRAAYPAMARELRGKRIPFSLQTCYRLYSQWKLAPDPLTVARNYSPNRDKEYPDYTCRIVISEAIARRVTVRSVALSRKVGPSYRVIHSRFPDMCRLVTKLAKLKSQQTRLTGEENALLESFFKA